MSFIKDFYSGLSFEYWQSRIDYELDRAIAEQDALTGSAIIGAYSSYLQLVEIVFHHIYLISKISEDEEAFKDAVFISNAKLKKWIEGSVNKGSLSNFLRMFVFTTVSDEAMNKEKFNDYLEIFLEAKKDFIKYHDVLNAFKHGFRLRASNTGSVGVNGREFLKTEAVVTYFSREDKIIYKNTFGFSIRRTMMKVHFLLSAVDNAKIFILSKPGEVLNQEHYFIDDREVWNRTFGSYHFRGPI